MGLRIGIAGNIGVGKSTLTEILAQHLKATPHYEQFQGNPYLDDFYRDMKRWAFQSQIYFLIQRVKEIQELARVTSDLVLDRTIYEDAEVFARNLYQQGKLVKRDFQTYYELYKTVNHLLPPPNLLIYLAAEVPTLLNRIRIRGRESERRIDAEYLDQLNRLYEAWIDKISPKIPVLRVNTNTLEWSLENDRQMLFHYIDTILKGDETPIKNTMVQYMPCDSKNQKLRL